MSDFEDKLNAILSSPDAMAQVAALAQQFSGGGDVAGPPPPEEASFPAPAPSAKGNSPGMGDLLGHLDPAMVAKLLPLLGELNDPASDRRAALLHALRPFLKPERQAKVDQALQAARMIHMGKKLLGRLGE